MTARPPYVPVVVGVSGHRDIRTDVRTELALLVREQLLRLVAAHPHGSIIVLTGLAEGADQLVAHVAFDLRALPAYEDRIEVVACLPMPQVEYEADFEDEGLKTFRSLLERCSHTLVVDVPPEATTRSEQYRALGRFIARESRVLFALWDGRGGRDDTEPDGIGGTAEVVEIMRGDPPPDARPRLGQPRESGLVVHVVTPRAGREPRGTPLTVTVLDALGEVPGVGRAMHERVNAFNATLACPPGWLDGARDASETAMEGVAPSPAWSSVAHLVDAYACVDALSIRLKRETVLAQTLLAALAGLGGISFALFTDLLHFPVFMVVYALAALGAICFWAYAVRGGDLKNRYLDYRAAAEGLRVQIFWTLGGVQRAVSRLYLGMDIGELDWVRQAIGAWTLESKLRDPPLASKDAMPNRDVVRERWLDNQRAFYARGVEEQGAAARRTDIFRYALGAIAMIAISLLVFQSVFRQAGMEGLLSEQTLQEIADTGIYQAIASITLLVSALAIGYAQVRAFREEARKYLRMAALYREALARLDEIPPNATDGAAYRELLADVGRSALTENGEWFLLHRDRQIEF